MNYNVFSKTHFHGVKVSAQLSASRGLDLVTLERVVRANTSAADFGIQGEGWVIETINFTHVSDSATRYGEMAVYTLVITFAAYEPEEGPHSDLFDILRDRASDEQPEE